MRDDTDFFHRCPSCHVSSLEAQQTLVELSATLARYTDRTERLVEDVHKLSEKLDKIDERQQALEREYQYAKSTANTLALTAKACWAVGGALVISLIKHQLGW